MKNIMKLLGFVFSLLFLYGFRDTNCFKVNRVYLRTEKLKRHENLKIVQISDMHDKSAFGLHKRLVKEITRLSPDIIVLTGDLIDRRTSDFQKIFSFVDMLAATNIPIYFVTGNHEWDHSNIHRLLEGLRRRNVNILANEQVNLELKETTVALLGIHNTTTNHENIPQAFQHVKENRFTILLSHSPYVVVKYPWLSADLILSGHTHGGQIRFPWIGAVVGPGGGMFPELDKGLYEWREGKFIYVDSGLGVTGIPVRFHNQSQVSFIQIEGDN